MKSSLSVWLVGNPNSGKSSLFNALTGACQRVGNWMGVTVEAKKACCKDDAFNFDIIDLPGIYSLVSNAEEDMPDQRITLNALNTEKSGVILNVVDATQLRRHLYLTLQLLEQNKPVVLAVNMADVLTAEERQNVSQILAVLPCEVVWVSAHKRDNLVELKRAIERAATQTRDAVWPYFQADFCKALKKCAVQGLDSGRAILFCEGDTSRDYSACEVAACQSIKQQLVATHNMPVDILIAKNRHDYIRDLFLEAQPLVKNTLTAKLDSLLLNRFLGIPLFLTVMYGVFLCTINIGGAFQDFFEIISKTFLVDGLHALLTQLAVPTVFIALITDGIGLGITTTLTFIPVIGALFFLLSLLEDSGYMARAAFVVDRGMQALGLPGKAFVPLMVGFGCNVPAILGTRHLERARDRMLSIFMMPFMSCGARLAIYATFVAAFFESGGHNVVFALYITGIVVAVFTGRLLRVKETVKAAPMVLELPPYRLPSMRIVWQHTANRLKSFLWRAGILITPLCVLIGVFSAIGVDGSFTPGQMNPHAVLAALGKGITPVFAPMGIDSDNWPAVVGLMTGTLAKEVVVGTLSALYVNVDAAQAVATQASFDWLGGIQAAFMSIWDNLLSLKEALIHPFVAAATTDTVEMEHALVRYFGSGSSAIAYLLFTLLYFPCVSTLAAMARELNHRLAVLSMVYTTGLAYGIAVIFYQVSQFSEAPVEVSITLALTVTLLSLLCVLVRVITHKKFPTPLPGIPLKIVSM